MWLAISLFISATGSIFIAFLTMVRNPRLSVHRWLFGLLCMISAWVVSGNLQGLATETSTDLWLIRISFVFASLMGYCMLRFALALTQARPSPNQQALDLGLLVFNVMVSVSPWVIRGAEYIPASQDELLVPDRAVFYPIVVAIILYFVGRSLFVLNQHRRHRKGQKRAQLNTVFAGLLVGTCIGVTTNVILPNVTNSTLYNQFSVLTIIAWTAILVYAISQYRFLDIRWAASRAVVYILTLSGMIVTYLLGVFLITTYVVGQFDMITQQTAYLLAAIFTVLTFGPLKRFFDGLTHNIFYRNQYDIQIVLDQLGSLLAETVDIKSVMTQSTHLLHSAIRPERLHMVVVHKGQVVSHYSMGSNLTDPEAFIHLLKGHRELLVISDDFAEVPSKLQASLAKLNIAAVARLQTSKEYLGYIAVGYKQSGHLFSKQDIDLLRIASDQLAVALQNGLRFREIQMFNRTLQIKIDEATRELREKNRRLRALDKAKDEFISTASHQMRTPLTSIKGYISMVLEGQGGQLKPEQRRLLSEAYNGSQRMVFLIADFLSLSRIRTDKFVIQPRPMQLQDIVAEEIERLHITAKNRELSLIYEPPTGFPRLMLDEEKLRQVVMNLIDNAIYYTRPGGEVRVILLKTDKEVIFKVQDTGVGVPKADQRQLFTKFFRASNASKLRPDGTGIGLFLVRKIIALHGGAMIFESKENKGSTFGFRFPLHKKLLVDDDVQNPANEHGQTQKN